MLTLRDHVERLWQALDDTVTCNHKCRSMWQLLKKGTAFYENRQSVPWRKTWSGKSVAVLGAAI